MSQKINKIEESLTKTDVNKEIKVYVSTDEFKSKIEKIVKDRIKNEKELEDKIIEITSNVISQLYKALWVKRNVWKNDLKNKTS